MNDRILVAHEWLEMTGGSENCFEQIVEAFPGCSTAALWNNAPSRFPSIDHETWLAHSRLRNSKAAALPFMHRAWRTIPLAGIDTVVASSHAFSHSLAARAAREGKRGFAYVHTPARYIWAADIDPRGRSLPARAGGRVLRPRDVRSTDVRVSYAANSRFVAERIAVAWDRQARVIYPAVDVVGNRAAAQQLSPQELDYLSSLPEGFILGASRLIEYKRLDTVIGVGEALRRPVVIVGSGDDELRLREIASSASVPVVFAGRVSGPLLQGLYRAAAALVFPPIEDFGIVPVEAIAWGTPVVVGATGGAREGVEATGGGVVAPEEGVGPFAEACRLALELDMHHAVVAAEGFSNERYRSEIAVWVSGSD